MAFVLNAPLAVAMTDRQLRFLAASPRWLADFGLSVEQVLGHTSYELAPGTDRYRDKHLLCLAGETVCGDPELVDLAGQRRWMTWDASPWRDDDGEVGGMLIVSRDLTAQKEAELDADRQRAFAHTILQNVPLPMLVKSEDGRVVMMNPPMEQLYGVAAAGHIGKTVHELAEPHVAAMVDAEDRRALEMDEPLTLETEVPREGLGPRFTRKTKSTFRDGSGQRFLLTVTEDVTAQRHAAMELERTKAFLTNILDSLPEPLHVKDETGRIVIINQAATQLMGRSREELLGKTAVELYGEETAAQLKQEDDAVLASGELSVWEESGVVIPGRGEHTVRILKLALRDPAGQPHVLTIIQDITEERGAAAELQRTREFLQTVFDNMPAGLVVKDASNGQVLMMNPALEQMYDLSGDSIGKTTGGLLRPDQAERYLEEDREVIANGGLRTYEEESILSAHGERFMRRRKLLIPNGSGPDYLLTIAEDITDRKLAQDALKEAVARAEAANVAKSEFLANMSHEIRTPLNGVLGLADALGRMPLTPAQKEIVELIVSSGKSLTAILSDVLDLAKAEAGQLELQLEPFSLRETVGAAAFLFETVARDKGLDFKVCFEPGGPDRLVGDPVRVRQVVSNLISNAVKFTAEGEIAITAVAEPGDDGDAVLKIQVRDTGPGFSEEVRARLFTRFEQGDGSITRRYGGTGLGLSIANALALMMGGDISCTGAPGEGACFMFQARLNTAPAMAASAPAPEQPALAHPERPIRVLLAEDHAVNQKVVQLMLDGAAELVITADGQAAVDAFFGGEAFDLVLMDTQMPVLDGLSAIRAIRAGEAQLGRPRTPIISLTANAMAHQVAACLRAGADAHLAKPITSEGLYAAINKVLDEAPSGTSASNVA